MPFLWKGLGVSPVLNLAESIVDNVFRDSVLPEVGSVVYCDLAFGNADHSGIYIGGNRIVSLSGGGDVVAESPEQFLDGPTATAISIYVSCRGKSAVGSSAVAGYAERKVGSHREYGVVLNNCHQFVTECLTRGSDLSSTVFMSQVKQTAKEKLDADTWRVWKKRKKEGEVEFVRARR